MKHHETLARVVRLIWNQTLGCRITVVANTRRPGKRSHRLLITAALSLPAVVALAAPGGGEVITGSAGIDQSGLTTTISQTSQNLSLTWDTFNIDAAETVNFVQPGALSLAVNRILDTNGSQILGRISANGQVFLINPNGILFGQGAQVNVGGLVASTLDFDQADIDDAIRSFSGDGTGAIINQGILNAADGGYVALLGNSVSNQGTITAPLGSVVLGAGSAATLTFNGNQLASFEVDQSLLDSLAENGGLIQADGGWVILTAGARAALQESVVNNTGVIRARTVENLPGNITLLGGMAAGTVLLDGTLDASAPDGGDGGFIDTSAAQVRIADGARVTTLAANGNTGTWLIDPTDFTISSGSPADSTSGIGADTLTTNLATNNVEIQTVDLANDAEAGDINVNAGFTWNANKLTLTAHNDININAVMTANDAASLDFQSGSGEVNFGLVSSGFSGRVDFFQADGETARTGTGFLTIDTNDYNVIGNAAGLRSMSSNSGYYALGSNIDGASITTSIIGISDSSLDGLGHRISNLNIDGTTSNTGLFATLTHSTIRNLGLVGGTVMGLDGTGALVGEMSGSSISDSYSTANVTGNAGTGGLVGRVVGTNASSVSNSYAAGLVAGDAGTGGLVGSIAGTGGCDISNSHATGNVTGGAGTGGLVGSIAGAAPSNISNSYATGIVGNTAGGAGTGGLVGSLANTGNISGSYATGAVTSTGTATGGLVGSTADSGTISDSCASGNVQGDGDGAGGLVGSSANSGDISDSYATGDVQSVGAGTGGLVGSNTQGAIINSFAAGKVNGGGAGTGGLVGSNTLGAISQSFAVGNVSGTGNSIAAPNATPESGASTGGLVGSNSGTLTDTYAAGDVDGYAAGVGGLVGANDTGGSVTTSYSSGKVTASGAEGNSGTYAVGGGTVDTSSAAWNTGPDGNPVLATIHKTLSLSTSSFTKTYDGEVYGDIEKALLPPCCINISELNFASTDINAGEYSITPELILANAALASYFTVAPVALTINQAELGLNAVSATKIYDGNTSSTGNVAFTGLVDGDTITLATQSYASKNVLGDNGSTLSVNNGYVITDGNGGNNYNVTLGTANGTITEAALGLNAVAGSKTYDGNKTSAGSVDFTGLVGGDTVTLATQSYDSKNVLGSNGSTLSVNTGYVINDGNNGKNYSTTLSTATGTITKATLGLNAASDTKTYDGNTTSTATVTSTGLIGGDTVTLATQSYDSKNVLGSNGSTLSVNTDYVINDGNDGKNYSTILATAAGTITEATLSLNAVTDAKVYDGDTTSDGGIASTGLVGGDTLTGTQSFGSKNVLGTDISTLLVDAGYVINDGNDGKNYSTTLGTAKGTITQANLDLNAVTDTKVYDGNTTSDVDIASTGLVGGDTVTATQSYGSKNVLGSNGSTLSVNTGYVITDDNGGNNYNVTLGAAEGTITQAALTLTSGDVTKTYDGGLTAPGAATVSSGTLFTGDSLTGGNFAYTDKNVGDGNKTVTASGVTVGDGTHNGNYNVTYVDNVTSTIDQANLTLASVDVTKTYDGYLTASGAATVSSGTLFTGDSLTGGTFAYTDKNVGSGDKTVTTSGVTVGDGTHNDNYNVTYANNVTSSITPKALTVTDATADDKVFDNNRVAVVDGTFSGLVTGESLSLSGLFDNETVGTDKTVTLTGVNEGATKASNYRLSQPANLMADVTPLPTTTQTPQREIANFIFSQSPKPNVLKLSPPIVVTRSSSDDSTSTTDDASVGNAAEDSLLGSASANRIGSSTRLGLNALLDIVDGGVKLEEEDEEDGAENTL
jgi:filamentous hemagglutinin family protein